MTDFDGKETELVVGKLRGFRGWKSLNSLLDWQNVPWGPHSKLQSISHVTYWSVNNMQAKCPIKTPKKRRQDLIPDVEPISYPHQAPYNGCRCGVYGHYKTGDTVQYGIGGGNKIYGAFDAWGKILLGTNGFRCQHAKITALVSPTCNREKLRHIASYYGVPHFLTFEIFEQEFPASDLSGLLPQEHELEALARKTIFTYDFWKIVHDKYSDSGEWTKVVGLILQSYKSFNTTKPEQFLKMLEIMMNR